MSRSPSQDDWQELFEVWSESKWAVEDFEHALSEGYKHTFEEWIYTRDGESCFEAWTIMETEAAHERHLYRFYGASKL